MATLFVDDRPYEVDSTKNLLHVCLSLGFNLPYFCWHPALGSVGACRQCAVKQFRDEKDTRGRIVMACMTPASDGTRISIDEEEAKAFRAGIIEFLMTNHPHDCPVCDEGGECHLQDMTVMTGHAYREFRFKKRTFRNQYLGPFINHEMNRCIQCYRCVRFYRDYAGGKDLNAFGSRDRVYFGRHEDGTLENEFSGNLVEVCPTGVFTDKTLKLHYTRKWDLQTAPSICVHCGLGCNTTPGERYGELRRILNRYNHQVNGYFLCDRGRFGYEFVNGERRVRRPMVRAVDSGEVRIVSKDVALAGIAPLLSGGGKLIGIGSPRASLESNYALKTLVGAENFSNGLPEMESRLISRMLKILREGPAPSASLLDAESADAVFVLGEDLTNVAPRLALALRQAVLQQPVKMGEKLGIPRWNDAAMRELIQQEKGPLFLATPDATRLDDIAAELYRGAPEDLARLGFAVAHELDPEAPSVEGFPDDLRGMAKKISRALREAERPLVISGPSCGSEFMIQGAANVAWALRKLGRPAFLSLVAPECNSFGLGLVGGGSLEEIFGNGTEDEAAAVIVLENDLYSRADRETVHRWLDRFRHAVVIDHLSTETAERAEFVLPAGTFAESDGTLVNNEGRAQRFFQVIAPDGEIQESWRWIGELMIAAGREEAKTWESLDDVIKSLASSNPLFDSIKKAAPESDFRLVGQKLPRQPHRYSGRTAMHAHQNVHEPKPPEDPDTPFSFSMEGYSGRPPSTLIPFFWSPGWNSVQSLNKFQTEVGGSLRDGNPGTRLFGAAGDPGRPYFKDVPVAFQPRREEWLLVAAYHIFGSEEMSVLSPAVAERSPKPYLGLNPEDAKGLGITEEGSLDLKVNSHSMRLPVQLRPKLPRGVALLPVGLPGLKGIRLPAWARLLRLS